MGDTTTRLTMLITNEVQARSEYQALRNSTGPVAYDIETTGLDPRRDSILLMQFGDQSGNVILLPLYGPYRALGLKLAPHFARLLVGRLVLAHNGRFEYEFTRTQLGVELTRIGDTYLNEGVLTAGRPVGTDLGSTLKRRIRVSLDKDLQKSWIGVDPETFVASEEQLEYAANDVRYMHRLWYAQQDRLIDEQTVEVAAMECAAIPAFAAMERNGLHLDTDEHTEVINDYKVQERVEGEAAAANLGAAWELLEHKRNAALSLAYEKRVVVVGEKVSRSRKNLPPGAVAAGTPEAKALYQWRDKVRPRTKAFSLTSQECVLSALRVLGVDRRTLPDLKKDTVKPLLVTLPEGPGRDALTHYAEWRKAQKVTSTYGDSMAVKIHPADNRLHPHYTQMVSTGRTSSSDPNGQNMPKRVRKCFKPEPGNVFVIADFAAMELRILAGMSNDPNMLDAFANDVDLHRLTAANAWPELYKGWEDVDKESDHRAYGKTGNFGFIYGGSAKGMFMRGVMPDLATAERIQAGYQASYPVAWDWIQAEGYAGVHRGYAVTRAGRKRYFVPLGRRPDRRDEERYILWAKANARQRRQAMNHPIQGTGADIAKLALIDLNAQGIKLVVMVHDELGIECREDEGPQVEAAVHTAMVEAGRQLFDNVVIDAETHIVTRWEK